MAKTQAQDRPPQAVEFAVLGLLHASEDFTRAYDAWLHAPDERQRERRSALDEAERRLEEAQHEVQKREAMARSVRQMLERQRRDSP